MDDLVLSTRLEMLKRSLDQVGCIVSSVQARRQHVERLEELLVNALLSASQAMLGIKKQVAEADDLALSYDLRGDGRGKEAITRISESLGGAVETINGTLEILKQAKKEIGQMRTRSIEIVEDGPLTNTLSSLLARTATDRSSQLKAIGLNLEEARQQANDPSTALDLLRVSWAEYAKATDHVSQSLFREYVDFLGGLALRDTGFDEGLCQIADELIGKLIQREIEWGSLTIPAREESMEMTPARIIRIGFPEWTRWALPLTAHELGHVVVDGSRFKFKDLIEASVTAEASLEPEVNADPEAGAKAAVEAKAQAEARAERIRKHRQEMAADAIATYVMGPAYVCSAILLRLNPLLAYSDEDGQVPHAIRAGVMFHILEKMNDKEKLIQPYSGVLSTLTKEWEAAVEQAQPPGRLSDPRERQREWQKMISWLDGDAANPPGARHNARAGVWGFLDSNMITIAYTTKSWATSERWVAQLRQGEGAAIEVSGTEELRDVLNAAWKCRIDHPDQVDVIEVAARELWSKIEEKARDMKESRRFGAVEPSRFRSVGDTASLAARGG